MKSTAYFAGYLFTATKLI